MNAPTDRSFFYRPAEAGDEAFLWECLALAAYEESAAAAKAVPYLVKWLENWPRDEDFGVIALEDDRPVGGAWARQFDMTDPHTAIHLDERTPEMALAVVEEGRGLGIGTGLLNALIAEARARNRNGLCLTVRSENPAVRLYLRSGFEFIPEAERMNRVGGISYAMGLRF